MSDIQAFVESKRLNRAAMREAHDNGRHGDGSKKDVVMYWASHCSDCHAVYRYEYET
jgi:hypothetical protein